MEIGINIDKDGKIDVIFFDDVNGNIRLEAPDSLMDDMEKGMRFKYEDGKLVRDPILEEQEKKYWEIMDMECELLKSNNDVIEAMEYKLQDKTIPKELIDKLDERNTLKNRINELKK